MGSLFGFFRFLTWGNLVVQGLLLLFTIVAALSSPADAWIYLFLWPIAVHNFLCLRIMQQPGSYTLPLRVVFKVMVITTGIYNILIGILIIGAVITLALEGDMSNLVKDSGNPASSHMMTVFFYIFIGGFIIHGIMITVNAVLSFIYLKRWKKLLGQQQDTLLTFDTETTHP